MSSSTEPLSKEFIESSIGFALRSIGDYLKLIKAKKLSDFDEKTLIEVGEQLIDVGNTLRKIEGKQLRDYLPEFVPTFNTKGYEDTSEESAEAIKVFVGQRIEQIERDRRGV
jgi:hypothetical protein